MGYVPVRGLEVELVVGGKTAPISEGGVATHRRRCVTGIGEHAQKPGGRARGSSGGAHALALADRSSRWCGAGLPARMIVFMAERHHRGLSRLKDLDEPGDDR